MDREGEIQRERESSLRRERERQRDRGSDIESYKR